MRKNKRLLSNTLLSLFRGVSIRAKTIFLFSLLLFFAVSTISFLNFNNSEKMLERQTFEGLGGLVKSKADLIDHLFQHNFEVVSFLASQMKLRVLLTAFPETRLRITGKKAQIRKILNTVVDASPSLVNHIHIMDVQGEVLVSTKISEEESNFSGTPEYSKGKTDLYLSVPYFDRKQYRYSISGPVFDLNENTKTVIGILTVEFKGNKLLDILSDYTGLGETGDLVLAKRDGNDIFFLNNMRFKPGAALHWRMPFNTQNAKPIRLALSGQSGITRGLDYRDIEVLSGYRYLELLDWGLVAKIDVREAFEPMWHLLKEIILMGCFVLMVGMIGSFFFVGMITDSLRELREGVELIARGNFAYRVNIDRRDEIGQLASTFNQMAEKLDQLYTGLEDNVRLKTKELENTLAKTEAQNKILIDTKTAVLNILEDLDETRRDLERQKADLEQGKRELEKANKELDNFVYTASHDLRAPLRGISSFASFIEEDYSDKLDAQGKDYLNEIRKSTTRMDELIEDLLELSKISRIKNQYENVPIADLIQEVKVRIEFDLHDHKSELIVSGEMPVIYCDRIKMTEVFFNLINNAIKFSSKIAGQTPRVEIGCRTEPEKTVFYVKDNGIGIDPQYQEQIFEIFRRLHTETEYEGTGAGLSIVKRVVDDYGGKIWVESELGKGATFWFEIPKD